MFVFQILTKYWLYLTLLALTLIFIGSLMPLGGHSIGNDKLHHLVAYFVLIFPAALSAPRYFYVIFFLSLLVGGCIELIQPYFGRSGEWSDMIANSCGLLCAVIMANVVKRIAHGAERRDELGKDVE